MCCMIPWSLCYFLSRDKPEGGTPVVPRSVLKVSLKNSSLSRRVRLDVKVIHRSTPGFWRHSV